MWEIQNQFTFLVLLRFFLCLWSLCANFTIVLFPEITRKNIFSDEFWEAKLGRILSICCTFVVHWIPCSFTNMLQCTEESEHNTKSQDCRGGADRGETQFGLRHWVVHQNTSSLSISTCCSRHNQENKGKIILLLPDLLSLFLVPYCLRRKMAWTFRGKVQARVKREVFGFFTSINWDLWAKRNFPNTS